MNNVTYSTIIKIGIKSKTTNYFCRYLYHLISIVIIFCINLFLSVFLYAQEVNNKNIGSKNILASVMFSEILLKEDDIVIIKQGFTGGNLLSAKSIFTPEIGELIRDKSLDESCAPNLNVRFHVRNIEKGIGVQISD